MERLTHYDDDIFVVMNECQNCNPGNNNEACGLCEHQDSANSRLAAYENTGNPPEQVAEWAKAEQEGRLVVLPCKVGNTVYFIKSCFSYAKSPMRGLVCMIKTFSESNTFTFGVIMESSNQERSFTNYDVGKTVFLTQEAAEAALKERE